VKFKQCLITGLCATLLVGAGGADSWAGQAKERSRTVSATYYGPAVAASTPAGFVTAHCHPGYSLGCVKIPTRARDRFVSVRIEDVTGQDVFAMVLDQSDTELAFVCTETTGKLPVTPHSFIEVWLLEGTCDGSTTPSSATTGTVTATFSRTS
jgi:hypothetical protein